MSIKNEWPSDCNRFIGFIDIMGFKDMIARKSHEEIGKKLLMLTYSREGLQKFTKSPFLKSNEQLEKEEIVRSLMFSDSILFITRGNTLFDLFVLSAVLEQLQEHAI